MVESEGDGSLDSNAACDARGAPTAAILAVGCVDMD